MNIQLNVTVGQKQCKAFFQSSSPLPFTPPKLLHKHRYAEIHLVTGGSAFFNVMGNIYTAESGSILIFPPGLLHCYIGKDEGAVRDAFQIDCEARQFAACRISPETVGDFFDEFQRGGNAPDYARISAYIALFCSYLCPIKELDVRPITDYGYRIGEFLSRRYGEDLHLSDLARELCLSERQAERLVTEHTGARFRDALAATRINIAAQLYETTDMSLTDIALYVGYRSYAGFWKAMKKHGFSPENKRSAKHDSVNPLGKDR